MRSFKLSKVRAILLCVLIAVVLVADVSTVCALGQSAVQTEENRMGKMVRGISYRELASSRRKNDKEKKGLTSRERTQVAKAVAITGAAAKNSKNMKKIIPGIIAFLAACGVVIGNFHDRITGKSSKTVKNESDAQG